MYLQRVRESTLSHLIEKRRKMTKIENVPCK